jgi:CRP-like cAMP-binding protein
MYLYTLSQLAEMHGVVELPTKHRFSASDMQLCISGRRLWMHKLRITQDCPMLVANRVSVANSLLAALPDKVYQSLHARLEPITLSFGEVLYHPGETIRHVYFPTDTLVSLLTQAEGHQALEVGMVGREGMLGIPLALGVNDSPVSAVVQGAGMALRMTSAHFRKEFQQSVQLQREVYHYIYELMIQMTQTAACNRFHCVEARLARWLLMTRDRVRSNQFHLTQDLLSNMLGVRRVGITKAAGDLRQRKLISYNRGEISILDGDGLEAAACQCYQIVKDMHDVART